MVCIPCIVVPFFLFIWHRFIQPYVLKFWNPWKKVDNKSSGPVLTCPMQAKKEKKPEESDQPNPEVTALTNEPDKKND